MRRINPQWVFLIILTLWIPVLCFADESESTSIDEELIAEKIENLERLRHISEVAQERRLEQEEMQIAKDSESSTLETVAMNIYGWGFIIFGTALAIYGIVGTAVALWKSCKFNYHLYIEYGEFAYGKATNLDEEHMRDEIAKKIKYETKDTDDYSWFRAVGFSLLGLLILTLCAILWPIALFVFGPELLTSAVAYRKRKKMIFEKKLKGENVGTV